jgi:two-component system chemotaxis response regulator CheB
MLVVHHFPAQSVSALPSILNRAGSLVATQAADGERVRPGRIYAARPDRHLLVQDGHIRLSLGPREHGHRPAIDPLFRSAARSYGPRAIGVILSGTLDDGTTGLLAIKQAGGLAVVQDPDLAAYPGMGSSAIGHVPVDHILAPSELGAVIDRLVREPVAGSHVSAGEPHADPADPTLAGTAGLRGQHLPGQPSELVCPECGGVLWATDAEALLYFRCQVGHAYSGESLLTAQSDALEGALWRAVRAMEEKAELSRRLAAGARARGLYRAAAQFEGAVRDAEHGSHLIRQSLLQGPVRQAFQPQADPVDAPAEPRPIEAERS